MSIHDRFHHHHNRRRTPIDMNLRTALGSMEVKVANRHVAVAVMAMVALGYAEETEMEVVDVS